jgi:hypothetical protein
LSQIISRLVDNAVAHQKVRSCKSSCALDSAQFFGMVRSQYGQRQLPRGTITMFKEIIVKAFLWSGGIESFSFLLLTYIAGFVSHSLAFSLMLILDFPAILFIDYSPELFVAQWFFYFIVFSAYFAIRLKIQNR